MKGKIIGIDAGQPDLARLSFCLDPVNCPLTVIIPKALTQRDRLDELQGKNITVKGLLSGQDGNAQIMLQNLEQLFPDDTEMPSLMKAYDVDEHGHYSAGTARAAKAKTVSTKKQTATLPIDIPGDAEDSEPGPR